MRVGPSQLSQFQGSIFSIQTSNKLQSFFHVTEKRLRSIKQFDGFQLPDSSFQIQVPTATTIAMTLAIRDLSINRPTTGSTPMNSTQHVTYFPLEDDPSPGRPVRTGPTPSRRADISWSRMAEIPCRLREKRGDASAGKIHSSWLWPSRKHASDFRRPFVPVKKG
jgi:hypothetical protein